MDAYEATRIVFSRIQSLDPENAPKIMGLLLIQDHGEKEMIRLAFGPEALLHSVVLKARKDLGLLPPSTPTTPSSSSPSPFLLGRQNSSTRLMGSLPPSLSVSCPSWAPSPAFSRTNSSSNSTNINGGDDLQNSNDELISPSNPSPSPFYGGDLIDDFQLQDQLSFLNDPTVPMYPDMAGECRSPSANGDGMLFPYAMNWGVNGHHRKSCSVADLCLNSDSAGSGFGWKPCLYYARGYCKNGMSCRFLHGMPDDSAVVGGKMDAMVEQQCHELLMRSKSQRLMASAAAFPYSPTPASPSASSKCMNFLLQQQQSDGQRAAIAAAAAAALMLGGDDTHKFMGRSRLERSDLAGMVNPGSRQIYLTFPADSTFREEDVSNYFSIYGPVQDVRIPYQQKRMFGFVTFVYPETVKLILAKGNPHFVCDARVLVKPYKEKGKVPDKYRKQQQQQAERGDFSGCSTPNGLDSRDPYDLQQLGARMLYNSNQEALLRRKLEEQQQASDLQHAIELQGRRFMGLQLLDFKTRNLSSSPSSAPSHMLSSSPIPINSTTITAPIGGGAEEAPPPEEKSPSPASTAATTLSQTAIAAAASDHLNPHGFLPQTAVNAADKEESAGEASPNEDSDFQESSEHNLPDSPFASPTKSSYVGDSFSPPASAAESDIAAASPHNNHLIASNLLPATSTLDMASFNSCFFQMPRFSSGHGAVGM